MEVMTFDLGLEGQARNPGQRAAKHKFRHRVCTYRVSLGGSEKLNGAGVEITERFQKGECLIRLNDFAIAGDKDRLGEGKSGARHNEQLGSHGSGQVLLLWTRIKAVGWQRRGEAFFQVVCWEEEKETKEASGTSQRGGWAER